MDTINLVILGVFALFGIVGALVGFSKGLIRSAIKVASIILAIVVAFAITPALLAKAYQMAGPQLEEGLAALEELFVASPTLKEYFPTLVMALISPILFVVVFAICLLLVSIIRAIVLAIFKFLFPKKKGILGRLGGLALGALGGVLIAMCFVFPITGYFTAAPAIYVNIREVVSTDEQPIPAETEELIINLPNIPNVQTTNNLTKDYFDKLVSYNDGQKDVSALQDVVTITSLVPPALRFANSLGDVETMDTQAIKDIVAVIGSNKQLRTITAEVLSAASKKWVANQPFMGFNLKDQLPEDYKFALDIVLEDLTTTTEATVVADLNNFVNTIETLKHLYGYANMLSSGNASMAELEGKLTDVLLSLDGNTEQLVHELISQDVMEDIGVENPEFVADLVADVISSAIHNIDENQTADDAAAINSIMHFAAGDENVTPQDVVDDIVKSPAITQAISDAVNVENAPVITVSPENKVLIAEALDGLEEGNEELVEDLKKLFNIN